MAAAAASLQDVMGDLDSALATQPGFLVGAWIGRGAACYQWGARASGAAHCAAAVHAADAVAQAPANDTAAARQLEWNARSQVRSLIGGERQCFSWSGTRARRCVL